MTVVPASTGRMTEELRKQLAPKATDDELRWLLAVSERLQLDPIAGHLVLIPRYDGTLKKEVSRPAITADGRLVLAERTGELDGFIGPQWCGPKNDKGEHEWVDLWDSDDYPHAARVLVYRKGRTHPVNGTTPWKEFSQWYGNPPKLMPTWVKMPAHMLGKCALSLALRRAFGDVIPSDADVEDDFAQQYEREQQQRDDGGRRRQRVQLGEDAVQIIGDAIERHSTSDPLDALPLNVRQPLRRFIEDRKFPWPTDNSAVVNAVTREQARIERELQEDSDAYGGTSSDTALTSDAATSGVGAPVSSPEVPATRGDDEPPVTQPQVDDPSAETGELITDEQIENMRKHMDAIGVQRGTIPRLKVVSEILGADVADLYDLTRAEGDRVNSALMRRRPPEEPRGSRLD